MLVEMQHVFQAMIVVQRWTMLQMLFFTKPATNNVDDYNDVVGGYGVVVLMFLRVFIRTL